MKRIFKWILVGAIGVIYLTGCQPKWKEYRSEELGYSVLMPRPHLDLMLRERGNFTESRMELETPRGALPAFYVHFMYFWPGIWECRVTCGSLTTDQNQQFTSEEFIDFFLEQTWNGWFTDEVYRKEICVEGLKGLEYQFAIGHGRKSAVITERILVGNGRFYVLNYSRAFSRRAPKKKIERFFNSFHLIPCTEEPGSQETHPPDKFVGADLQVGPFNN